MLTTTAVLPVTIANGASLSGSVYVNERTVVGLEMPAAWTAASITFQASQDDTTYNDVYDNDGTELTVTAAASRYIILSPAKFVGAKYLKVRSGTSGSAVNQGAARVINVVCRAIG